MTPIVSATGTLTSGGQIETTAAGGGTSSAQSDITNLQTMISQVGRLGIGWNFENQTTAGADDESFRFNTADPNDATVLYFHQNSLAGRFDEFIEQFAAGGFIYLQDNTNTGNSFLFVTTAVPTDQGTYYSVPVTLEQKGGTFTAVEDDRFNVEFLPASASGSANVQLPNRFLNEISEQAAPSHVRKVDTEGEIRFWLRTGLVTPSNINDSGVGLIIAESNGDLGADGDTLEQSTDVPNAYLYMTIGDTFHDATDLNTLAVVITENLGETDERVVSAVNLGQNFQNETALDAFVGNRRVYRSNTGYLGNGSFLNYQNTQTIELYFIDTEQFFTISEANAPNVDITRGVKNIPETALANAVQAKLNQEFSFSPVDRFRLDQFVETSTTSTPAVLTGTDVIYYRDSLFTSNANDWLQTTFDSGLPPNLGSETYTLLVAVPHATVLTSFNGSESGTATIVAGDTDIRLDNAAQSAYDLYTVTMPVTASATNVFQPFGTTTTITELDASAVVKVGTDNLLPELEARIDRDAGRTQLSAGLADLNSHISVAGIPGANWTAASNPPDVRGATYSRTFAMLWDENQRQTPGNYFGDLADPTITVPAQANIHFFSDPQDENNRFQGKQSWVDSTVRVNGAPLTDTPTKVWAFSCLIPETFEGNIVLFQAGPDSTQRVLRCTMVDGVPRLQARRGNLDGATENHVVRRFLQVLNTDLTTAHWAGNSTNATDFELRASDPVQNYLVQVTRYENGAETSAESFTQNIADRDVDVAAQNASLFSNELTVTHSYDADFDNAGETVDVIRLSTTDPADGTISYVVDIDYTVTEVVQQSSSSQFQTINTVAINREIDVVFLLEKENGNNTNANAPLQLKINVNGVSDNDFAMNLGANVFDFSDVRFGDTRDCLTSNIQVYDFTAPQPFDFPTHSILNTFYQRRNEWFGLFRAPEDASRNYTIDGGVILTDEDATAFDVIERFKSISTDPSSDLLEVFQAADTSSLSAQEILPANYTDYDFVNFVTYESGSPNVWRSAMIDTLLLQDTDIGGTDNIRVQDTQALTWTVGTRTIDTSDASAYIWRISLVRVEPVST